MISHFKVQEQLFSANSSPEVSAGFVVKSMPRPYRVDFAGVGHPGDHLVKELINQKSPLLLVDSKIRDLYLNSQKEVAQIPTFSVSATEEAKQIHTVLEIVDFMEYHQATKSSMLYVVGGGILQDLGAFACAMYKRGLPWIFVPTTLLAQGDSCVGGKAALNHKRTKNLLALFSAPRRVLIATDFLGTLPKVELFSGVGESFRLCITGGVDFLNAFARELPAFLRNDGDATKRLIATSLSAKRAIIELDEFELDLRRSMNYGHSFGHALEALSNYRIPHGVGVTLGILVENQIGYQRGVFGKEERDLILNLGRQIVPDELLRIFAETSLDGILDLLRRDKKTEGTILKMVTLERIGQMRFIDFVLDDAGEEELRQAVAFVLSFIKD